MRFVTFLQDAESRFGALLTLSESNVYVVDLPKAHIARLQRADQPGGDSFPESVLAYLQADHHFTKAVEAALDFAQTNLEELETEGIVYAMDAIVFQPPIPNPGKIICVGMNYRQHIAEMGHEPPTYPVFFAKYANALVGHGQAIRLPRVSQMVDYEAELAFVIGKTAKDIAPENAFDVIAGYAPFNDVSVRDYQNRTTQWQQGKMFDTAGPMGPALVTADEVSDPQNLAIELRLNGQVMQHANTSDLFFDIPKLIAYLTAILTLEPGDIIATGTPSGVGSARKPPVFLKDGDVVQIEIAELGMLENPVKA